MPCLGYSSETIRCGKLILVKGYMCATSWCELDLTFDLAYLMLFYVSVRISDTILSLLYLISFYLNLGCCTFGCLFMSADLSVS